MIVRYFVTYRETVTRQSRWIPDPSNLGADQLPWRQLSRGLELFYDVGGLARSYWQPEVDQLAWRGLKRGLEYTFDDGGFAKQAGWLFAAQAPAVENLAWQHIKRGLEYSYDDGVALKLYYGALFSVQVPPPVIVVIRPTGTAVAASPSATAAPASPMTRATNASPEGSAS